MLRFYNGNYYIPDKFRRYYYYYCYYYYDEWQFVTFKIVSRY
jgi:hypothetical protein